MSTSKKKSAEKKDKGNNQESELEDINSKIGQLKNLNQKVPVTKKQINDYRKSMKENKKISGKLGSNIRKRIEESWNGWIDTRNELTIKTIAISIDELQTSGVEVTKLKKMIDAISGKDIPGNKKAKEIEKLVTEIESTMEGMDHLLSVEGIPSFVKCINAYEEITGTHSDLSQHKKYFKKLLKHIQKGDMKNILVFSNLLYTTVQTAISEDASKDRFKAIHEQIDELMRTMEEFRKYGLRSEGIEREIEKLRKGLDSTPFSEAQSTLNRLTKNVSRTEKEYFRRKGSVSMMDAKGLVEEYGSLIDLGPQEEKLETLREEMTTTSPRKFMEESQGVLTEINDILFTNFKDQVDQRFISINEQIDSSDISDGPEKERFIEIRGSIKRAMENKNITEAMDYLSLAESQFGETLGEMSLVRTKDRCMALLENIEGLVVENIEIENLNEQLIELESQFLGDDIGADQINMELDRGESIVNERIVEIRTSNFQKQKDEMVSILDSIDLKPDKKTEILTSLEETESLLSDLEEDGYQEKMLSIRNGLNEEVSTFYRDNYNDIVTKIQDSVGELEMDEEMSTSIKSRVDQAGVQYRERDYLASGTVLMEVDRELEEIIESRSLKEAEDLINSAEFMFEEAKKAGVDVKDQTDILANAKDLLQSGDIEGSKEMARSVEASVKGRWMESKRQILREDLDGLKDYFIESSELGLDIDSARGLLDDAEGFFEDEKYDEVNEKVYMAKESIEQKRREYFSNGSMDAISNLKTEIEELKDLGLNTVEAETLVVEAEKLFMEEDYEASYSLSLDIKDHLNFTKEAYLKEDIPQRLEDVGKKVGKLEMMGLDTELARSYLDESSSNLESGSLIETLNGLEKAEEITDEIYRSHISLTIPETIVDVQKEIENAMEEGLEISEIRDLLGEAESMFNDEEYDLALHKIEKAKESFDMKKADFYRDRYEENLDMVEDILGNAKGLGTELELSRDNINIARDAFERGDFQTSNSLMEKIKKFLEQSMDDKESSKRREIVQTYYNEVRTLLTVAEGENIDVSEERNLFRIAGDLLADGDFDQAEHVLEGIKLGLNDKRVQMKKRLIESSIQTTEILLQNMNEMGVDTSREYGLVEQIKNALRDGDLDLCDSINMKLQETLHKNQGPYLVQKVQNEISDLKGRVVDMTTKGMDMSVAHDLIGQANDLFEKGDLEGSEEMVARSRQVIEDIQTEHDSSLYKTVMMELNDNLEHLRRMGIPISDEEEMISIAQTSFENGEIAEGTSFLETALVGASAKMNSFQSTTAEGYMQQIKTYLDELRSSDVDVSDLMPIFNEGIELHENGEDDKSVKKFSSILELGEEIRDIKEVDDLRIRLSHQKVLYSDLVDVGMKKSKKARTLIEKAEKIISADVVEKGDLVETIEKLEPFLEKKSKPLLESLVKKHISDARAGLTELKGKDADVNDLKEKLKEAATLMRDGDLSAADRSAMDIIEELERIQLVETEKQLKEEVASVRQMLTRLKTLGSNVSNPEKLLSRAESALLDGKIGNAERLIKNVRTAVRNIVKRNMRETAQETIEFVDAMLHYLIDNFSGVSSKLGPSEVILDEARNLFKNQKFKAARTKADEARISIEKLDIPNITQFFYVFQSSQAKEMSRNVEIGITELKNKGSDTSKVKLLYDKAQEHFSSDEFERGRQMITLAKIMLSEIDQQSVRENAFDELNNAHVEILTKKRKGKKVTTAYKTYEKAKEAFSMREYKKSILLAKKASYQVRKS